MSWQEYVDTSLISTGAVDKAAIYSVAGDSRWAGSAGFEPSGAELATIVSSYKDPDTDKKIFGTGFHIGGEKYLTIRAEDRSLYGKKGKTGIIIVKTVQALLIAHYPDTVTDQQAATVVEKLADYLIGLNY